MLSLLRGGFFKRGETWADLKCEGKEPSVSDKLIIDVIDVIKMSMQSFTILVGIGSKSENVHMGPVGQDGAPHRHRHNWDFVGGFNTRECESEGMEERMTEILLMKNELRVFAKVAIEEWSGILWNCFFDFAVGHWFGFCATEPGFAWVIGAIEIWLIDWLILSECGTTYKKVLIHHTAVITAAVSEISTSLR